MRTREGGREEGGSNYLSITNRTFTPSSNAADGFGSLVFQEDGLARSACTVEIGNDTCAVCARTCHSNVGFSERAHQMYVRVLRFLFLSVMDVLLLTFVLFTVDDFDVFRVDYFA
jgi:hypothetical protein